MIIPNYLKDGDLIGITACSCGVLKKIDKYEKSINNFINKGFRIIETNNVRTSGNVSSDEVTRWKEFKELLVNDEVKMINIASGGDFLYEMLPLVDFNLIKENIKWIGGSSDPTSLLFTITTMLDIATIYTPCNMSGYDMNILHDSLNNYFEIIKGKKVIQNKYDKYELNDGDKDGYNLDSDNEWIVYNGNINESGILIGGCIECIKDIIGTKFDNVNKFIDRYKDKGIIWYFDVFAMSPETLYNTLLQFKNAGWFRYTKAILIGKVKYVPDYSCTTYEDVIGKAVGDIPTIYKFDVGHVKPSFTMINGADVNIIYNDNEGQIRIL
ncbi:MAG: LD-carboxypeptidase [Candidatus Coprovivens sp.]